MDSSRVSEGLGDVCTGIIALYILDLKLSKMSYLIARLRTKLFILLMVVLRLTRHLQALWKFIQSTHHVI